MRDLMAGSKPSSIEKCQLKILPGDECLLTAIGREEDNALEILEVT